MAITLNTPELYNITAFDADKSFAVRFNYHDSQATRNQLVITQTATGEVVYDEKVASFALSHTIPRHSLRNGVEYSVRVKVFHNAEESDFSAPRVFICFATPIMTIVSPTDGKELGATEVEVIMTYEADSRNSLDHYVVKLFDGNSQLIKTSNSIYNASDLRYVMSGLDNNQSYYVQAAGTSTQGMTFESNKVYFYVRLDLPEFYSVIYAENDPLTATIQISSNIITIDGEYQGENPPTYVGGTALDLRNGNELTYDKLIYDTGYEIADDFTLQYKALDYNIDKPLIDIDNGKYIARIKKAEVYTPDVPKYYSELVVAGPIMPLIINSRHFSTKSVLLIIKRSGKNIFFDIIDV